MTTFVDLQIGYYNALSQGLGFPVGSPFQMMQPSSPVVPGNKQDALLWNYVNLIPPFSLSSSYVLSGGNQFFSNYSGLLSALQAAPNTFNATVGPACEAAWEAFVPQIPFSVPLTQFPQVFQRWAMTHGYTDVAQSGATTLAGALLDPIFAAQTAMLGYQGKQPDWDQGFQDLVQTLAKAPSRKFSMSSSSMNSSASSTWAASGQSAFFGLWSTSSSSSSASQTFASSAVSVDASFDHVTQFGPVPGGWYNSSAMGEAYSHQTGAPWVAGNPITWQTTFDPNSGNMARFAGSLVCASGMKITVTSSAVFSQAQQTEIRSNSSAGLWPFYSQNSDSGTSTSVAFGAGGSMTVEITSAGTTPIVLGINVLTAAQFVGHSIEGAKLHQQAMLHRRA